MKPIPLRAKKHAKLVGSTTQGDTDSLSVGDAWFEIVNEDTAAGAGVDYDEPCSSTSPRVDDRSAPLAQSEQIKHLLNRFQLFSA